MAYANINGIIGNQPLSFYNVPDTTQRFALGAILTGSDNVWGGGAFIYLKAGGTINMGNLVVWDATGSATQLANTANQGRSVAAAIYPMTSGQYGWFVLSGQVPVSCTASVAAGTTFGITGAGTVGANSAGKQILNAVSVAASTNTVVKANVSTQSGSNILRLTNPADGWFYGLTLSGTGLPGTGTITSISPDGLTVTMSSNATATGTVSVTGTYTGFILAQLNAPFAQGAIT